MIRNLLSLIFVFAFTALVAKEVDIKKARIIAKNVYLEKSVLFGGKNADLKFQIDEEFTIIYKGFNTYYVFTFEPSGFVIIAADDVLDPVIGYSVDGSYKHENQPDGFRNYMQTWSDAVDYIRVHNIEQNTETQQLWKYYSDDIDFKKLVPGTKDALAPLLTSKWDQGYPYNYYCPEDAGGPGGHVYAGCVATAMSQVMYYWRYPEQGTGSHSYYCYPYGTQTANYGVTTYQWESMTNSAPYYYPEAIAELQYHCGVGVEMMYGPDGSGAYSHDVPPVFENFYGYSNDCYFTSKEDHTNQEWINLLKDNLDNGWPMYYSGYSNAGGHAFVCDGYQDNNFHFNFGWSGSSDGYYSLTNVGGFSSGQGAVVYTYPESGYPWYCSGNRTITSRHGSIEDGSGPIEDYENNVSCSWLIAPESTQDSIRDITLSFVKMDIDNSDVLTLYDGPDSQSPLLGTYTGSEIPAMITSGSNKVYITFESGASETGSGWLIEFSANSPDFCQGIAILDEPEGNLEDGSGSYLYHNNSTCMWKIIPEAGPVTLWFTSFETEPTVDRVQVWDIETEELLAEYSGTYSSGNLPAPVTASSGKMFVAFATNGSNTHAGWTAHYSTYTGTGAIGREFSLHIFPNPTIDRVRIISSDLQKGQARIQLCDMQGLIVLDKTWIPDGKNYTDLDISSLSPAVYFLTLTTAEGTITERLIKK